MPAGILTCCRSPKLRRDTESRPRNNVTGGSAMLLIQTHFEVWAKDKRQHFKLSSKTTDVVRIVRKNEVEVAVETAA